MVDIPIYWIGAAGWVAGFILYIYGTSGEGRPMAAKFGTTLCWLGFLGTFLPHFTETSSFEISVPASLNVNLARALDIDTLIRVAWVAGFGLVVASWIRFISYRLGWIGFCIGMAATVISWTNEQHIRIAVLAVAMVFIMILIMVPRRGRNPWRPWDHEAALVQLCHGDKGMAKRLIKHELGRSPNMSRAGAALAAATRLRHERR